MVLEFQRDSFSLNGEWESIAGHEQEDVWKAGAPDKLSGWKKIVVPGPLLRMSDHKEHESVKCVWVRRSFQLDEVHAGRGAVLKWNGIRFGATAWINGREVATHPTMGPHTALLPDGALRAGENRILIKVAGWGGLPKSKSDKPLIPTGGGVDFGPKQTSIFDDVYLEFYERAYLKWILAIPDVPTGRVTFRVWVDGWAELPETLDIRASVRLAGDMAALRGEAKLRASDLAQYVEIPVAIREPRLWTPQTPNLYVAELVASTAGKVCDKVRFRFGMREIRVEGGHYRLNGEPLWFRGSNLLREWQWGEPFASQPKRYLIDEARAMNLNSFRTHTEPPCTRWADIADEHGMMILAEMPVLYNFADFKFTPAEYEEWHKNVMVDFPGWITKLWNHPSIVMWVLSNESRIDNKWEAGPYRDAVVSLDPTRPTMRTGEQGDPPGTKENLDLHPTANWSRGPEGALIATVTEATRKKDPQRTLTNTEYMNWFAGRGRVELLQMGRKGHPDFAWEFADFAAEHTEAMRRVQLDGIFPYMYAGWTGVRGGRWREGYPTRMAAALHSSMAPVLASVDLFDRNFPAGRSISTPLYLINETHGEMDARIDVYITPRNPLLLPDADALKAAIWRFGFERTLKGDTIAVEQLRWKVPETPGVYYLAVITTRKGDRAVVSQRIVRSVAKVDSAGVLRGAKIILLGADRRVEEWMTANKVRYASALPKGKILADTVVICDSGKLTEQSRRAESALREFVRTGGKLVVLNQPEWAWKELLDFEIDRTRTWVTGIASRVFPYEGVEHPILEGVDPECFKRWNGLPGTISNGWISGKVLDKGQRLLWQEDPDKPVVFGLPIGRGEVVISLLHLRDRINPKSPSYDPVAERIFVNLLVPKPGGGGVSDPLISP